MNSRKFCLYAAVFAVLSLSACRPKGTGEGSRWADAYRDSAFLAIEGGDLELLFLEAKVNHRVYSRAVERIHRGLRVQGDTLYLSIRNGAEVKVSKNIYDYVAHMVALNNRRLKTDTLYEIRQEPGTNGYFVTRKDAPVRRDE